MTLWLRHVGRFGFALPAPRNLDDEPAPAIMAGGTDGGSTYQYDLVEDGVKRPRPKSDGKPPYRVPSMAEIRRIRPNGFKVVSTFAGCGGSSLGYRMAGFSVLWANEFVDLARACYAANARPSTVIDGRDIREVQPDEILSAIKLRPGELDLLDGSPPCASFSTAGRRQAGWNEERKYSDKRQRVDDLFFEFARLLKGLQPRCFVAENVSGLVKGVAKGYFLKILRELQGCGYAVEARLLDAQWLGVPQQRQRIIFVGVRHDLAERGVAPAFPDPLPYRYSVRDAIPWIDGCALRDAQSARYDQEINVKDRPALTIRASESSAPKIIQQQGAPRTMARSCKLDEPLPTVMGTQKNQFRIEGKRADGDISGYAIGDEAAKLAPGQKSSRYFQLERAHPDRPSPAILAAHGGESVASVVHPVERRKFSIEELRRICSFPDDFELVGSYAQQWERLGRAVPPLMMRAIAEAVRDRVLIPAREVEKRRKA